MNSIRIGRIVLLAMAIEVLAIVGLVAMVAAFGPNEKSAAMKFAEQTGAWFGPLSGAMLCLMGGYWVGATSRAKHVLNGSVLGAVAAAIDIALLAAGGAEFKWLFAASNVLRVVSGTAGGWLAAREHRRAASPGGCGP